MSLESLLKIVRPPTRPVESGVGADWASTELRLGTALPEDYKEYVKRFGSGIFDDFIMPFTPFASSKYMNLFSAMEMQIEAQRVKRLNSPKDESAIVHPFELYPQPDGLLVWGTTTNAGDYLYWHVQGHPSKWRVVVYNLRNAEHELFDLNLTGFLSGILSRSLRPRLFPKDFPGPAGVRFVPARGG